MKCTDLRIVQNEDDSAAYKTVNSLISITEANTELSKKSEWLCANRFSLDIKKIIFLYL